jgi:hypothetical protein
MDRIENDASNNSCLLHVLSVAAITFYRAVVYKLYIYRHRLMGGIYEGLHLDGFRCHDIHTEFHKELFSHLKLNKI